MGRGQYDRQAAKAKREQAPQFLRPSWPYTNPSDTETALQAKLDAANDRIAKLERLCQTHGLMIE